MLFVSNSLFFKPPELKFGEVRGGFASNFNCRATIAIQTRGQLQIESTNLHESEYIDTF